MKYFFVVGEASGDLHASNVIRRLREIDQNCTCIGLGGTKMREAGCTIIQDYSQMAFMGVIAVLKNWKKVINNFRITYSHLRAEQPDVLVLVDYPSFNLRVAKFAKKNLPHTKIVYYIPPTVWAWKTYRIHQVNRYCDKVLSILPFEEAFYKKFGYCCHYVGNPTVDSITMWKENHPPAPSSEQPYIALLPGSRKSEVEHCLPLMLRVARQFPQFRIKICKAPLLDEAFYNQFSIENTTLTDDTYTTVASAYLAIVNSGTAALETALLGCPQVALYYVAFGKTLGWLRPLFFKIPNFTLVNILLQKRVIQELVTYKFTYSCLYNEVQRLISDDNYRQTMQSAYKQLYAILGRDRACDNTARILAEV